MAYPLTPNQQSFIDHLKQQMTDNRAVKLVEESFQVRNANSQSGFQTVTEAVESLTEVVDEVAG